MGSYVVQPGDSPASMAGKFWGDQRQFVEIIRANGGRVMFHPGETIQVPDKPSVAVPVISEELIQRLREAGMWGPAAAGSGTGTSTGSGSSSTPVPTSQARPNSNYVPPPNDLTPEQMHAAQNGGGNAAPAATPPSGGPQLPQPQWNPNFSPTSQQARPNADAEAPARYNTYFPSVQNGATDFNALKPDAVAGPDVMSQDEMRSRSINSNYGAPPPPPTARLNTGSHIPAGVIPLDTSPTAPMVGWSGEMPLWQKLGFPSQQAYMRWYLGGEAPMGPDRPGSNPIWRQEQPRPMTNPRTHP